MWNKIKKYAKTIYNEWLKELVTLFFLFISIPFLFLGEFFAVIGNLILKLVGIEDEIEPS